MKVLLFAHSFAPRVGGAERLAFLLADGLAARMQVTVATRTPADPLEDAGLRFAVVRRPGFRALWRLIRDADVVHLAGPVLGPLCIAWLQRRAVVIEHHGYQAICPNGLLFEDPAGTACPGHFMARRYGACLRCRGASVGWAAGLRSVLLTFPRRWLSRGARVNVAVSPHVEGRLALPRSRVISHGVPAPAAAARAARDAATGGVTTFGFVGRLVREKGLPVLLDAAAALAREGRALRLLLVGEGPERARLERRAAELGITAEFRGALGGAALAAAEARIDVAVMPSLWEETAGLAAMEAMRRGVPVIASATGGLADVVSGHGELVPPGDAAALAAAMRGMMDDPARAAEVGADGARHAGAAYTVERMLDAHEAEWTRAAS